MESMERSHRTEAARTATLVAMLILLTLILAACGGSAESSGSVASEESASSSGDPVSGDGEAAVAESESGEKEGNTGDFEARIVKTADLGLKARDVRETSSEAQRLAARFGGDVLNSRTRRDDDSISARLVLTVPAPEFEAALEELRGLGREVTTDSVKGKDVTGELVDLESRERNLLAAEESLLELYDEAENVEDSLSVRSELTEVRGEIERVQGRIQYLEDRTSSSRITLQIEPTAGTELAASDWDPAGTVARAWKASLGVLQTLATATLSVVVFGWWLASGLAATLVGFTWLKRNRTPRDHNSPETTEDSEIPETNRNPEP